MTVGRRALIIGIESYPSVNDNSIDKSLPGTLDAAKAFRDWLTLKWDSENIVEADRQIIFCSEPSVPGGRPASLDDINQALLDLKAAGQDATEEFFFFFSGHGFSYVTATARADMLIASNYKSMELSGVSACLNLDKAVYWLRQSLGPGLQYYFVDACRNELAGKDIAAAALGLPNNPQTTGEATTFLMQSTAPAATAAADGKFSDELLAGLKGHSTAKTWDETDPDAMLVRYDTLRMYVRERMKNQRIYNKVEGEHGEADGIIARLKPAPSSTCEVHINGFTGPVSGFVETSGRRTGRRRTALSGQITQLRMKPDQYSVTVDVAGGRLRDNTRDVTLFDDEVLTFEIETASPSPVFPPASRTLSDIVVPGDISIELQEFATGKRKLFREDSKGAIPKGRYAATVRDKDDRVVKTDLVEVKAGQVVDVTDWSNSAPHVAIAARLPTSKGMVDFSESLGGPVSDPDLGIWLALLGGGRILAGSPRADFAKIATFPLHDFSTAAAGSSLLYVLAGFDDPRTSLDIGTCQVNGPPRWHAATQPGDLTGVRQLCLPLGAGPQLISFRIGQSRPYTIASLSSPNRATLVTLTLDEDGAMQVSQYLLPLGHLLGHLHPFVAQRIAGRNQLADVKLLAESMRAFRKRRDVWKSVPDRVLDDILYTKWIDPIASALVAYELIRRGRTEMLPEVVGNLSTYFPDLPDIAALTRLAHMRRVPYRAVPLFLDGLQAIEGVEDKLPLPAGSLDYTSPWTAWRGAPE
nr:caspase family protein [Afipia massiliensis]